MSLGYEIVLRQLPEISGVMTYNPAFPVAIVAQYWRMPGCSVYPLCALRYFQSKEVFAAADKASEYEIKVDARFVVFLHRPPPISIYNPACGFPLHLAVAT